MTANSLSSPLNCSPSMSVIMLSNFEVIRSQSAALWLRYCVPCMYNGETPFCMILAPQSAPFDASRFDIEDRLSLLIFPLDFFGL